MGCFHQGLGLQQTGFAAQEIVIADFNLATLEEKKDTYDRLMAEVRPHFR